MSRHPTAEAIHTELEVIQLLQAMNGIQTEFVAAVRGMMANGILWSGVAVIQASGVWSIDQEVPFAFVHIANLGAASVTVTADAPQGGAPGLGEKNVGVKIVPAGASLGFNLVGRTLTLYGNANTQLNVELHTKPDYSRP